MKNSLILAATAASLSIVPLQAQEDTASVSGSLSLDFNTHFISYGADVWSPDGWEEVLFQPSIGITFDSGKNYGFYTGIWGDINNNAATNIGKDIQEIDVWVGAYVTLDKFTFDLTFQQWYYGSEVEGIIDFKISYDTFLTPTLTIHNRIEGVGGQETGTVVDLGVSYGFEAGIVSFTIPLNAAWATDDYHGGDSGIAYVKTGIMASLPMSFIPEGWGGWDLHGGLTLWHTPDDVIPGNPDETFITGSIGVGCSF